MLTTNDELQMSYLSRKIENSPCINSPCSDIIFASTVRHTFCDYDTDLIRFARWVYKICYRFTHISKPARYFYINVTCEVSLAFFLVTSTLILV
jgi:hypothetical protein